MDLLVVPPPDTRIWRYMDVAKFLSMLQTSTLFFAPISSFSDDPFEGAVPRNTKRQLGWGAMAQQLRHHVFVNCWHMSNRESAAMWKLYARSNEAIAIVSSVGRLAASLPRGNDWGCPQIGAIQYVDFETGRIPDDDLYWRYFHKRESFEHERELRAVLIQVPADGNLGGPSLPGVSFSVTLNNLIEHIRLAPTCPKWIGDAVEDVAAKYGLRAPIERSALDTTPIY